MNIIIMPERWYTSCYSICLSNFHTCIDIRFKLLTLSLTYMYVHHQFSPIEELEEPLSENMGLIGGFSAASAAGTSAGSPGQLQGDERGRHYHQQGGASYHDNTRRTTTSPRYYIDFVGSLILLWSE